MKNSYTCETKTCNCIYCTATYYSYDLYKKALTESKTEDDRVHSIYQPIARITIPRRKWTSDKLVNLFDDAQATAISNMFTYSKLNGLTDSEICLRALIRCARAGASYVLRQFNKHDRAWVKHTPETDKLSTNNHQERIIGRRVYPTELADFEEDGFILLVDKLQANTSLEDSYVNRADALDACRRILSSSDPKVHKQAIANLTFMFGLFDAFDDEIVPAHDLIMRIREELDPLTLEIGIKPDIIDMFFQRSKEAFGINIDLTKLRNKAYNKGKSQVLYNVAKANVTESL